MAEQKYNVTPKMGRLIVVKNQNRKPTAKEEYISIKVENLDGNEERYLSFTQYDIDHCPIIDAVDLNNYVVEGFEDKIVLNDLKDGRMYPAKDNYGRKFTMIKTLSYSHTTDKWYIVIIRVCASRMKRAEHRDTTNPEDRATVAWYYNMFD